MSGITERIQRLTDAKSAGEEFAMLFRRLSTDMPPPREMESAGSYARRLCSMLAAYDGKLSLGTLNWKAMAGDFAGFKKLLLETLEKQLDDAAAQPGQLRAITYKRPDGAEVTEYEGDPRAWMQEFAGPRWLGTINKDADKHWVPGRWEKNTPRR